MPSGVMTPSGRTPGGKKEGCVGKQLFLPPSVLPPGVLTLGGYVFTIFYVGRPSVNWKSDFESNRTSGRTSLKKLNFFEIQIPFTNYRIDSSGAMVKFQPISSILREVVRRESGLDQLLQTNIFEKLQNILKLLIFIS
jgi:hypothetical protein